LNEEQDSGREDVARRNKIKKKMVGYGNILLK